MNKKKTKKTFAQAVTASRKSSAKKTANKASKKKEFPTEFPFWGRLKIDKKRTTLVIDDCMAFNKTTKRFEEGFVNREATHVPKKGAERIFPNPDKNDKKPMYLKKATKKPKKLIEPHNKKLNMPNLLKSRYSKNNKKA